MNDHSNCINGRLTKVELSRKGLKNGLLPTLRISLREGLPGIIDETVARSCLRYNICDL